MHFSICGLIGLVLITLTSFDVPAQEGDIDAIRVLVKQGRHDEASRGLDELLSNDPDNRHARFLKGIVLTGQNRTDEAIEVFLALAEQYPKLPEPHNNLAVLYASRGDYIKARDALLVAINTHPSYATAHENLGDIYAKMAGLAYDKALELDTKNESAKAKLALMLDLISISGNDSGPAQGTMVASAEPEPEPPVVEPVAPVPADVEQDVLDALQAWASAWAARDVERYLSFYGSEFSPSQGLSRSRWEAVRRIRLAKPSYIEIDIDDPRVDVGPDGFAWVTFLQGYQSDTYGDRVRKSVKLAMEGERWLIVIETTIE